ncbi:MAG TPA: phosphatidylglycerophosphatase A [Candidatus Limnocylindria bacterium]|nr:phosphatidylglycerophosphatase A [Candidatus Limnocylindria bacterium]
MPRLATLLATGFGVGYAPVAPGTAGSLLMVPLLPALATLRDGSPTVYTLLLVAAIAVAVWAADRTSVAWNAIDDSRIVADELAGMLVTGAFLPGTWTAAAMAFLLFRVFDVWKPLPIRQLEKRLPGGVGVVADDLLAGVYAGLVGLVLLSLYDVVTG